MILRRLDNNDPLTGTVALFLRKKHLKAWLVLSVLKQRWFWRGDIIEDLSLNFPAQPQQCYLIAQLNLLAPTGALMVIMVYHISAAAAISSDFHSV